MDVENDYLRMNFTLNEIWHYISIHPKIIISYDRTNLMSNTCVQVVKRLVLKLPKKLSLYNFPNMLKTYLHN